MMQKDKLRHTMTTRFNLEKYSQKQVEHKLQEKLEEKY